MHLYNFLNICLWLLVHKHLCFCICILHFAMVSNRDSLSAIYYFHIQLYSCSFIHICILLLCICPIVVLCVVSLGRREGRSGMIIRSNICVFVFSFFCIVLCVYFVLRICILCLSNCGCMCRVSWEARRQK